MKVVRSDAHRAHFPSGEIYNGELVRPFESPERWDFIVAALNEAGLNEVVEPEPVEDSVLNAVHDVDYLNFLRTAWSQWTAAGSSGDMIPTCFPVRRMAQEVPDDVDGKLGYYSFAAETSITSGTWTAAHAAASLARTAQRLTNAPDDAAFALCRPPGHHASRDYFGGYCFINNAAIAAQGYLVDGAERVAILDIDFHHGNGTQDIFYERNDVLFASLHGDPRHEFPHFLGFANEVGDGAGEGFNANYPLPPGTTFDVWLEALEDALFRVASFSPDAVVVSLGVDTFEGDPISSFRLRSDDFHLIGSRIGELRAPTVYCMEGGYAVAEIGTNTVNVLTGHLDHP
jgi:acetoin utilization deacetylase AcuC-like enzyme